jgi:hypothetical protein
MRIWVLAALLLSSCSAAGGIGRARVLDDGVVRGGVGADVGFLGLQIAPGEPLWLPTVALSGNARRGFGHDVELGLRGSWTPFPGTTFAGLSVDGKYQWFSKRGFDAVDVHGALDVALAAYRFSIGGAGAWAVGAELRPLMFGASIENAELTIAPHVGVTAIADPSVSTTWFTSYGASLALHIPVKNVVTIVPELHLNGSPISWNGTVLDKNRTGATLLALSLGFGFSF